MPALHGAGQGLKADVVGAAIPAEGDELDLPLDLPLPLQGVISRLHPGQGGAGALKGRMDVAVLIGGVYGQRAVEILQQVAQWEQIARVIVVKMRDEYAVEP